MNFTFLPPITRPTAGRQPALRYLALALLCVLCAFPLSAQEDDPVEQRYVPLYQAYKQWLGELGYRVGRAGNAPWVRGQYVLEYNGPGANQDFANDLAKLRQDFGAVSVAGQCGCGKRKLYAVDFGNNPIFGEERGKAGKERVASSLGKEEVEPNLFVVPELDRVEPHPAFNKLPPKFQILPSGKPAQPIVIAVLDSGVDPTYQTAAAAGGLAPLYLWDRAKSPAARDCYATARYGWDFVNNDNAPLDDNSHGTHVASRIAGKLAANAPSVNYQFMSVKMLDENGVGNTFHASCAVLFAAEHGADVINASWGVYGERPDLLKRAFRFAESRGVATMTSAGNEGVNLTRFRHYPSGFALETRPIPSIFFVSASWFNRLWPKSNWREIPGSTSADFMAAPGADQLGLMPRHFGLPGNRAQKSGTSVSTPNATALAAHYLHLNPGTNPATVRTALIDAIQRQGTLTTVPIRGNMVEFYFFDWVRF